MMVETLTRPEAVLLGTPHVQSTLLGAGIRALAFKGPSFVELGVRAPRQSVDVDILIHPDERERATEVLARAGWRSVSGPILAKLEAVQYSNTLRHRTFPVTVDLHHILPGVLDWPDAFDVLWRDRATVHIAHHRVLTFSPPHALVFEALNAMKCKPPESWAGLGQAVLSNAERQDPTAVVRAAESIGAEHTALPLIRALGMPTPTSPLQEGYQRWAECHADKRRFKVLRYAMRHAPEHVPRLVWHLIALDEDSARFWTDRQDLRYRGRLDVLRLRVHRALSGLVSTRS